MGSPDDHQSELLDMERDGTMDMLLRDITIPELTQIFARHQERSPAPYLKTSSRARRRRLARKNGIWDDLTANLDPRRDIPAIRRSAYRNFQRHGDRTLPETKAGERRRELGRAAMALWLGHPNADVDYLQDLLWAYCEQRTWVMAAHEGRAIDLGSAGLAADLAEILHVLGDRLEEEVREWVIARIDERIFRNFWDFRKPDAWKTVRMNWNHVCNGEIIRAALYLIEDPEILAHCVHGAIQNLTYALDGFAADGACEEGPGYWAYGFGHFLYVAHALCLKTDGALNIAQGDRIEKICRYPLAAHIAGPCRSTFADSSHGYIPARTALIVNEFADLPELYELCATHPDGTLRLGSMHELGLYRSQKIKSKPDLRDYLLPDLGQVKLRGRSGKEQLTLMALAGHNGVPHNHNDIGSFMVHRGERLFLTDPGAPRYSRKTFSARRYESVFCNSWGHSVPIIDGRGQKEGKRYYGTLEVENLNGAEPKRAIIDMSRAYPRGTVQKLVRTLRLKGNKITLEDTYRFARRPRSLEEAFITFEKATVARGGRAVRIGPKGDQLQLKAVGTEGRFTAKRLVEESKEGRTGEVITRIAFVPVQLEREMTLKFEMVP